jgi:ribokinase
MARVVVLGSSNTDMTVRLPHLPAPGETLLGGSFLTGPGGKGANQAVAARRAGAEVVFLAAVGDDPLGRSSIERYRAEGIDVSHVLTVRDVPSGVALIFVGDEGENMIGVAPGANSRLDPPAIDRLPDSLFGSGDVLLAGLEVPLDTVARAVRRAHRGGMRVILNPAPADARLLEVDLLPFVEILTPNCGEVACLSGRSISDVRDRPWGPAEDLRAKGACDIVVTLGEQGCLVLERERPRGHGRMIRAYPVVAVDTVGAGDAFNGALAAAIAEGRPLYEAAVWASAAAAIAVTIPGAQAALPRREAIDRLAAPFVAD